MIRALPRLRARPILSPNETLRKRAETFKARYAMAGAMMHFGAGLVLTGPLLSWLMPDEIMICAVFVPVGLGIIFACSRVQRWLFVREFGKK